MIVIIDDIEYDVPESVGKKVQEANAYHAFSGGLSPSELLVWLLDLANKLEKIDKDGKETSRLLKELEKKVSGL